MASQMAHYHHLMNSWGYAPGSSERIWLEHLMICVDRVLNVGEVIPRTSPDWHRYVTPFTIDFARTYERDESFRSLFDNNTWVSGAIGGALTEAFLNDPDYRAQLHNDEVAEIQQTQAFAKAEFLSSWGGTSDQAYFYMLNNNPERAHQFVPPAPMESNEIEDRDYRPSRMQRRQQSRVQWGNDPVQGPTPFERGNDSR